MNRWKGALVFPLLLGLVVALWLRYQPCSPDESGYRLEMDLVAPSSGSTWVQFDIGRGQNNHDRRNFWVAQSALPRTYPVALPAGVFRSWTIVPPATVHLVLAGARIIAPDGTVAAHIPAMRDVPGHDLILIQPAQPVALLDPGARSWTASAVDFLVCAGVVLLLGEFARRRGGLPVGERLRRTVLGSSTWASAHPRTTLLSAAALAVAASCHPVLFFGRSFVSPNNGVLCLYDTHPTLPGAPAQPVAPWNGSDINAMMWAHLPYSVVAHDAVLRDGELPLWNRYVMGGWTLLGQGQSMIGDPLYCLTVCANGASWAWDLRFLLSKLLFSFGVELVVWTAVRHLGIATLLAFSSSFLGFFSFRFNHPAFFSLSYAPWVLLCWLHAAQATTMRRAGAWTLALLAANWLELNSGTAKEASMLLLGMNGAGALTLLLGHEPWRTRRQKLALAAASCAIFLAISAPLWIVFLDALHHGYTIYDQPQTNQLGPGLLIGLFDDLFVRQLMKKEWHVDPALNFLALLGVCWALADFRSWLREPAGRAVVVVSVLALAMVFGVVPPAIINRLPLLKNIAHVDDTFICVAIVPLFVIAGYGLRACLQKLADPEAWRRAWLTTLFLLAGLAALYFGTVQAVPNSPDFGLQLVHPPAFSPFFSAYAPALFAAVIVLPWCARWLITGRSSAPANVLAIILCLLVMHFRHGLWLGTKFDEYVMNPQPRVDLQAPSPAVNFIREHQAEPSRTMGFGQILRPGFNMVERLETTTGADAVAVLNLAQWFEAAGLGASSMWWPTVDKTNISALRPFYDAMNVRYYLGATADAARAAPGLEKLASADLDIFESKFAWPRAFFTDRLTQYSDMRSLLQAIKTGAGRPFAAVQTNDASLPTSPPQLNPDQTSRQITSAREYHLTANTTSFTIDAPTAGVAVLNESFVPDNFRATLNGQPVPYFRINHIAKGIALPGPGTYRIRFDYWPKLLSPALWVALCGLLALLAFAGALCKLPNPRAL